MKDKQLKLGAALSYVQMAVNVLIALVYTPVMLKMLGRSEYGLYNTVNSTISMLFVLSFGFHSSYIRYYAEYKIEDNTEKIQILNGVFLVVFSFIGLIALIFGLYLTFHLNFVFDKGLTSAEYETAKVLMLLLSFNLAVYFPMSTFTSIISAHERYIFLKLVGIFKTILSPIIAIPLLLMGYRSVALVTVTVVVSLITDTIYIIYAFKFLKVRFRFRGYEPKMMQSLFQYSFFIAIHMIVDQINNNMDKFLLGRYVGTEEVAIYSVGYTIYHYYMLFSVGISGVFSPRVHHIINSTRNDQSEQKLQLTELFVRIGRLQFLLLALICSGIVFFGQEFLYFWAGSGYENAYYVALLLMIPATVPFIQNVGIEIQRALNKHRLANVFYLGMALLNLLMSIELCQRYGAVGSALGTAISFVVGNGIWINVYYHRNCNIDILTFWKSIFRMFPGMLLPVTVACVLKLQVQIQSIPMLLFGIMSYTVIYCISMWLISMNHSEKKLVCSFLKKDEY